MAEARTEKHPHIPARHVLDRIVLGGSDGVIEGVATTSALNGAGVDFRTILIASFAFALAGGLSMFFSNYLSRRAELDSLRIDVERERMEIETEPEEERKELESLLMTEGYKQGEVDVIMNRLTKDKEMWLRAQLQHELHVHMEELSTRPVRRALPAGIAFFLLALLSLLPYLTSEGRFAALVASAALSLAALFALGSRIFTLRNFNIRRGLESASVGAAAVSLLYLAGLLVAAIGL
ncbi:MAG: VIT1/CCC1 transporter family protein [Nitrososphaerales archaeon]|nr:VIT1/CCC1 transporter family protein [Nitrososphaerales archaeon]